MVAFALRADGWWLRCDIIWAKPNPMPESVHDRPTKSHEYVFLMSKSAKYYYDFDAIREIGEGYGRGTEFRAPKYLNNNSFNNQAEKPGVSCGHSYEGGRNKRSVWTIATQAMKEAHFATFPEKLVEPCILAGCPEGGTVLDPFAGTCTVGLVAARLNRSFIGIDLNPEYLKMRRKQIDAIVRQERMAV